MVGLWEDQSGWDHPWSGFSLQTSIPQTSVTVHLVMALEHPRFCLLHKFSLISFPLNTLNKCVCGSSPKPRNFTTLKVSVKQTQEMPTGVINSSQLLHPAKALGPLPTLPLCQKGD